jgi:hypothetical protein
MTNEFEQAALAYQKSSLEWQQRYNIAIASRNAQLDAYTASLDALIISEGQRDQAIAERDKLAARLEAAIELEAEVSGANRRLRAERDEARRALRIAAGVVSTMKVWSDKHPQDAYDWIVAQAQTDASRTADAEVQP